MATMGQKAYKSTIIQRAVIAMFALTTIEKSLTDNPTKNATMLTTRIRYLEV